MHSIAQIVDNIIKHKPYLSELLSSGIINISALARQIQPEVEKTLVKSVNVGAIVMALNRLIPYFQVREQGQLNKLLNNLGDLILRSNLCDYTFKNSTSLLDNHALVLKKITREEDVFYTMVSGVFETNLVVSDSLETIIDECFSGEQCIFKQDDLSSVTLKLPRGNVLQPGFYYSIMKELAWEGINLVEVVSSTNEFTVIVNNALIDKTFFVLKNIGKR
jgi:hypothetical protein